MSIRKPAAIANDAYRGHAAGGVVPRAAVRRRCGVRLRRHRGRSIQRWWFPWAVGVYRVIRTEALGVSVTGSEPKSMTRLARRWERRGSRRVLTRQPEGQTRIIHLPSLNIPRIASAPSWPMSFDAGDTMSSRSLRIDRIRWAGSFMSTAGKAPIIQDGRVRSRGQSPRTSVVVLARR